ncbi:AAA family ATPase [Fusibacter ferrireducens]|uniref:MoxR family ATPase n=1 Tax=Fusibacter ferrireducens TaxID=2785058 RepID=A0ABR9ZYE3_9FIRM|nr:MoxR family ATPase [Fusibacter ferrireducens]MBF4695483.1 MoxR family ATPase [Fusibacter ferrireducens]
MLSSIKKEMKKTLVGKETAIENIMIALLSGGHVLIEDLPGLGKTTLAKSFAKVNDCTFNRVQFTPDLMPSDLIGISIFDKQLQRFEFQKGPLFSNILLADEINRTSPKTQSSLLEAMEESQVTVDGHAYHLEQPFMVIATENPIEQQGTFPLPEAQLDRFMMRISLGYPSMDEEMDILSLKESTEEIKAIVTKHKITEMIEAVDQVFVDTALKAYIVKLCKATREHTSIKLGASPRTSVHLFKAAKAKAYLDGRNFVMGKDVYELFENIVSHRILLKGEAVYRGVDVQTLVASILKSVEVPRLNR